MPPISCVQRDCRDLYKQTVDLKKNQTLFRVFDDCLIICSIDTEGILILIPFFNGLYTSSFF